MFSKFNVNKIALGLFLALGLVATTTVYAIHSWGGYHWARTSNPFTLRLVDSVASAWDSYLTTASNDWSQPSVLDTTVVAGQTGSCSTKSGQVVVCSKKNGFNGILGTATIWASGKHITQGRVQLNDTYFNTSTYNKTGWRSLVMCQETGHALGLGHQDENFNNDPIVPHTCMDYFVPGVNEVVHPNQHDYDQLLTIYDGHLDSSSTLSQIVNRPEKGNHDNAAEWGKSVKEDAKSRTSVHEKDLGNDNKVFTFVFWAE